MNAATILVPTATNENTPARTRIAGRSMTTPRFTSMPTEIRKTGMKNAEPKNSILLESSDPSDTSRLSASPARKAPMIGSRPASSARPADRNMAAMMNRNRTDRSCPTLAKNWRPSQGSTTTMNTTTAPAVGISFSTNPGVSLPSWLSTRSSRAVSAAVSVTMVAPTVMATDRALVRPRRCTTG